MVGLERDAGLRKVSAEGSQKFQVLPEESDGERDEKEDGEGEDCYKTRGDGGGRGGGVR